MGKHSSGRREKTHFPVITQGEDVPGEIYYLELGWDHKKFGDSQITK